MTQTFAPVRPHGDLREVFRDIFFVKGSVAMPAQGMEISRNMTVVREGNELSLFNAVRLNDEGLAALDKLGKVKRIVKIGSGHGSDDAFYVDRYACDVWALPNMASDVKPTHTLSPSQLPLKGAALFVYETSKAPEAMVVLDRDGGVLIACDSLQNVVAADEYFNDTAKKVMVEVGFIKPANIGVGWLRKQSPQPSDFQRVKALRFRHLLSGHGEPLLNDAHAQVNKTIDEHLKKTAS